jgi:hypothetical protein
MPFRGLQYHRWGEAKAIMARLTPESGVLTAGFERAEVLRHAGKRNGLAITRRRLPCGLHLLTRIP